jgi:predicted SnoaL-like aldol condensation-catalyzing enzyme
MSVQEENKLLVRRLVEVVFSGRLEQVDELVDKGVVDHSRWRDRDGLKTMLTAIRRAYATVEFRVDDLVAEGDKVAVRVRCQLGEKANGSAQKVIDSIEIFRLAEGKLVEHWGQSDSFL